MAFTFCLVLVCFHFWLWNWGGRFCQPVVQSLVSNSLWPHGLQHPKLPCPSLSLGAWWNLCPLRWWCHPTMLSSVTPFSTCPQSFPASGSFQMSHLFASGGQSVGASSASASASLEPWNSLLVWTVDIQSICLRLNGQFCFPVFLKENCFIMWPSFGWGQKLTKLRSNSKGQYLSYSKSIILFVSSAACTPLIGFYSH